MEAASRTAGGPDGAGPGRLRRRADALRHGSSPVATAARRAVRVTVASCAGFFACVYGWGLPVVGTYALFAVVAMAGLSRIPGTGRQRATVVASLLPAGWVLVTVGTFLAVRTWTAVAGMLVLGFVIAYAAVAGPRLAGAAPGLQLLYILPCFPPYAPDTVDQRLIGTTLGFVLLVLAEALILPDPRTRSYRALAADACEVAAGCAGQSARPPWTVAPAMRARAAAAGEALRPSLVPEAERPGGPGLRQRALAHTGLTARMLLDRLAALPPPPGGGPPSERSARVIAAVREVAGHTARLLRGEPAGASPGYEAAVECLRRARTVPPGPPGGSASGPGADRPGPERLRRRAALTGTAAVALALSRAASLAVAGRRERRAVAAGARASDGTFWYAAHGSAYLWVIRVRGHFSVHSVYFQNAVRLALALAVARTVAGLDSLPHGFWATLAALSLTRTTVHQTRSTVAAALTGTLAGALVAGLLLVVLGADTLGYAVVLPFVMLVAFVMGPTRGAGWAQGMFTVVVSVVFAQLGRATWQLAEVRVLDVLTGSVIGLVLGLVAWPRGARGELLRSLARMLRAAAATVRETARAVGDDGHADRDRPGGRDHVEALRHSLTLAESAFAQRQSEPPSPHERQLDWQAALMTGHHVLRGAQRLRRLRREEPSPLGAAPAARIAGYADLLGARYERIAASIEGKRAYDGTGPGGRCHPAAGPALSEECDDVGMATLSLYFDTASWLETLATDADRITRHLSPAGPAPS
ncbi:FUSC family protein [Streptomyces ficellus]|uniref:FUSC family protein n=1 Tax=Streptomyces ficellus TaxID=1977088 RepID=A0A6I6F332_9ACTN|nr:FUSC family protein [Streptomyces ficellus]QGV77201.1 FUSC family protein [Streptomyces ficellus]